RFIEAPPNARRSSSPVSLRWKVTPMCSRCMTSPGASLHMISIASWSPRKSEPLTVSKAGERQSSAGWMGAVAPPGGRRPEAAANLLARYDTPWAVVAVDDHQRPQRAQPLRAEQLLDRRV